MTKFMPVRKMQIYFLSVAADKKALEGLHLHSLPPGVGGGIWIYMIMVAGLEDGNAVCHNLQLIRGTQ